MLISIHCNDSLHSSLLTMGHGQKNMYHRKNCSISYLHLANFSNRNCLFCACVVIDKDKFETALLKTDILIIFQLSAKSHVEK